MNNSNIDMLLVNAQLGGGKEGGGSTGKEDEEEELD
jgi:hypothetical protein